MLGVRSAALWQRLMLLVAAITISLSVLAMHQLAVDHSFAVPATSDSHITHHQPVAVEMQQVALTDQLLTEYHGPSLVLARASAKPCLGHDCDADHEISVLSCVLALTLLMLSWLLAPPRECRHALLFVARQVADRIQPTNDASCRLLRSCRFAGRDGLHDLLNVRGTFQLRLAALTP